MKPEQNTLPRIDLDNDDQVDGAIKAAVWDTLRDHKRRGQSVVVWQDGKVVTLAPEDIPVEDEVPAPQ